MPQSLHGGFEERSAVDLVGNAVGRDEIDPFTPLEAMALDGAENQVLVLARQCAERVGERRTDPPQRHLPLGFGR